MRVKNLNVNNSDQYSIVNFFTWRLKRYPRGCCGKLKRPVPQQELYHHIICMLKFWKQIPQFRMIIIYNYSDNEEHQFGQHK